MSTDRASAVQFTPDKLQAGAIDPDAIPSPEPADTPRHALAWTTNINMRPVDHDTIQWDAGAVEFADGVSQAVANGNSPRTLSPALNNGEWYAYKRFSSSVLQFTQTFSTAIAADRIYMGIVVVSAEEDNSATVIFRGGGGIHISAQSISVGAISTITANLGEVLAGIITGVLIRTSESGKRVQISSADTVDFYDPDGNKVGDLDITTEPTGGAQTLHLILRALGATRDLSLVSERGIALYPSEGDGTGTFENGKVAAIAGNLFVSGGILAGGDISGVGNVDLDSLSKRGTGAITVDSPLNLGGHPIQNVGNLAVTGILTGSSGSVLVNDDLFMLGHGMTNIGALSGSSVALRWNAHQVGDIGEPARRVANIWANGFLGNALALTNNQGSVFSSAQSGRAILYINNSGDLVVRFSNNTVRTIASN